MGFRNFFHQGGERLTLTKKDILNKIYDAAAGAIKVSGEANSLEWDRISSTLAESSSAVTPDEPGDSIALRDLADAKKSEIWVDNNGHTHLSTNASLILEEGTNTFTTLNRTASVHESDATTEDAFSMLADALTTGKGLRVHADYDVMTTGKLVSFELDDGGTDRNIFQIMLDGTDIKLYIGGRGHSEQGEIWRSGGSFNFDSGAGSNTILFNVAGVPILALTTDVICYGTTRPNIDDTINQGDSTHRWADIYGGGWVRMAPVETSTPSDTETTLDSLALEDGKTYHVQASVLARQRDGSDRNLYHIEGLFYRQGGGAVQEDATTSLTTIESEGALICDFDVDTNDVRVRGTGENAVDWDWNCSIQYREAETQA